MNTNTYARPMPGASEERDSLLVSALHLIADHAEAGSERFLASVIRESAVALDEYRSGYRLAYPQPDTGYSLVELELESVCGTDVPAAPGEPSEPIAEIVVETKFRMGDVVSALVVDEKVSFAGQPVQRVRSGRIVGITTVTETPGYLVDIADQVFNFDEKQLWRVGEDAEVAP